MTPFTTDSTNNKKQVYASLAQQYGKSMIVINHCGGDTSVLFDGNSMVFNYKGKLVSQLKGFSEDLQIIDTNKLGTLAPIHFQPQDKISLIHKALIFGIQD